MPVDTVAVKGLLIEGHTVIDDAPHERDHAIEVELPFLQVIYGDLPIVPLLFGFTSARAVAAAIAEVWSDETLLVVTSDLSHYECDRASRRLRAPSRPWCTDRSEAARPHNRADRFTQFW